MAEVDDVALVVDVGDCAPQSLLMSFVFMSRRAGRVKTWKLWKSFSRTPRGKIKLAAPNSPGRRMQSIASPGEVKNKPWNHFRRSRRYPKEP